MANYGNFGRIGQSLGGHHALPWSPADDAKLGHAFIDLDLDGDALYRWCRKNDIMRSPGAIDARLAKLNFFDNSDLQARVADLAPKVRACFTQAKPTDAYRLELTRRALANQVKLAKIEAATAPLYRPKDKELGW